MRVVDEMLLGRLCQPCDHRPGQSAIMHIGQRLGIDDVIGVAGTQQIKEVQPALAGAGAEPGEVVVADLGADAIGRFVACAGIIYAHPGGSGQASPPHILGFGEEAALPGDEQAHHLPARDVEPDRAQLRGHPPHRNLSLMVLGQHEAPQLRAEVAADAGRHWGGDGPSIRRQPALAPVADHERAEHQILHHEVFAAFEARAARRCRLDHPIRVNDPPRRLLAAALAAFASPGGRLGLGRILHPAWFDGRTARHILQARDLVTLDRDRALQRRHLPQQGDHQLPQLG